MKNTASIHNFQYDLVLPNGVMPVEDNGVCVYWLNVDRAPKKAGGQFYHTLEVTKQDDDSYRFLCGSQYDETFTGNDGEIISLNVNVAGNIVDGDYPITLKYVKLTETDISKYYLTEEVVSTLSVMGTTGVRNVSLNDDENRYYDLQGRHVVNPGKGLYIRNGKKTVVR